MEHPLCSTWRFQWENHEKSSMNGGFSIATFDYGRVVPSFAAFLCPFSFRRAKNTLQERAILHRMAGKVVELRSELWVETSVKRGAAVKSKTAFSTISRGKPALKWQLRGFADGCAGCLLVSPFDAEQIQDDFRRCDEKRTRKALKQPPTWNGLWWCIGLSPDMLRVCKNGLKLRCCTYMYIKHYQTCLLKCMSE